MKYDIIVKPLYKARHWEVVVGLAYAGMQVPRKFQFDGCSIPWFLRWRFKHGGAKFAASGMHDYLYRTGSTSKERADMIFYEIMIANKVNGRDAKLMYYGVKYGGFIAWNNWRKQDK